MKLSELTVFIMSHESDPDRTDPSLSIIGLTMTRSLGRRNINVVRIHPNMLDYSLLSKYSNKTEICPDFYQSEDALVNYLIELKNKYPGDGVLFPASDDCAYFLAKYREQLDQFYKIPVAKKSVMEKLTNKRCQYEEAQKLNLPIPETYFPKSLDDIKTLSKEIKNYPYVIKPTVAHKWRLASMQGISQGKKALTVHNVEELLELSEKMDVENQEVMIQEVIGGKDERLFTFLAYYNENAQPLAYCIRSKLRQNPIDFGYCTLTVSCHDEIVEQQSIKLLNSIGFHGICGVEWKLDPKNKQYKLIEVNPRAVNTTGTAIACGVDLPYIAVMDKIGKTLDPVTTWKDDVKWVWLLQDIWAAKELHDVGKITFIQWIKSLKGIKVHAVFAMDDLKPFVHYFYNTIKNYIELKLSK